MANVDESLIHNLTTANKKEGEFLLCRKEVDFLGNAFLAYQEVIG